MENTPLKYTCNLLKPVWYFESYNLIGMNGFGVKIFDERFAAKCSHFTHII